MCVCCVCCAWCDLVLAMLFKNQTSVNPLIKSNHSKFISKINIVTRMGPMAYNAYTVCIYIYTYICISQITSNIAVSIRSYILQTPIAVDKS
jgi:hypothetical protein